MKKNTLDYLFICAALLLIIVCTSCSGSGQQVASPDPSTVITDLTDDNVLMHKTLAPMEFEAGEDASNPYYKRVVTDDGLVYQVLSKMENEILSLPASETTIYLIGQDEQSYMEQVEINYTTEDGASHTQEQYRVYVAPSLADEG